MERLDRVFTTLQVWLSVSVDVGEHTKRTRSSDDGLHDCQAPTLTFNFGCGQNWLARSSWSWLSRGVVEQEVHRGGMGANASALPTMHDLEMVSNCAHTPLYLSSERWLCAQFCDSDTV